MKVSLSKVFLGFSVLLSLAVIGWLLSPVQTQKYHIVLTGLGKGRIHPTVARFRPYKGNYMGGAAGVAAIIKQLMDSFEAEPFNVLSLGSEISGTSDAYFTKGAAIVNVMNAIGYDLMLATNIEFSFGQDRLRELSQLADFPFLSSNTMAGDSGQLPDYLYPEVILRPGRGLRVAVVGMTPPSTPSLTARQNVEGLSFLSTAEALKDRVVSLRNGAADLVVLLTSHNMDKITRNQWQEIVEVDPDVCVMIDYSVEAPAAFRRDGIVVKTISGYNKSMEVDVLTVELTGKPLKISSFRGQRIGVNLAEIGSDPVVERIADEQTRHVRRMRRDVVASFSESFQRRYTSECPIGNFVADAMREETGAMLAIQNSGGIQGNIGAGDFKLGDLFNLLPFDNQLVVMELTGADLIALFQQASSLKRGLLQISGGSYSFSHHDQNKYSLTDLKVQGKPVNETTLYRVVTNSFLADGGDYFMAFQNGKKLQQGRQQRDVVLDYINRQNASGPINLKIEGRITTSD